MGSFASDNEQKKQEAGKNELTRFSFVHYSLRIVIPSSPYKNGTCAHAIKIPQNP